MFEEKRAQGLVIPKLNNLSAVVALSNGQSVNTWTVPFKPGENKPDKDKPIKITPAQGSYKAAQDKKEVALYQLAPKYGESVGLALNTALPGVRIGHVNLAEATSNKALKLSNGFEVIRSGDDSWTLRLEGGEMLAVASGSKKASYTIKLEVWPLGTYAADETGAAKLSENRAQPIMDGNKAKTKPIVVSVKVNVR
jgi:hypothetical protein